MTPEIVERPPMPDTSLLVTQDDTPVDSIYVEKLQCLLVEPLYSSWEAPEGRPFLALANVGLFFAYKEPPLVPDAMLSLDVPTNVDRHEYDHRSYFCWVIGKMPEVVIEIVSDRRGGEETDKMKAYSRLHIPYYVIYDPKGCLSRDELRAYALNGTRYKAIDPGLYSDVGIGLKMWTGEFEGMETEWLRWCDPAGEVIPTGKERADNAKQQAEELEKRANAAEARIRKMAERLRELGESLD